MYIREAHPTDGRQAPANVQEGILIRDPQSLEERRKVAKDFAAQFKLSLPVLVDTIDDQVEKGYAGWPDRIYIVDAAGAIAYKGAPGPQGFRVGEAKDALEALLAQGGLLASSAEWTQWRGRNRDGRVFGFRSPAAWPAQLSRKWKVEVGIGYASPLITADGIYVHSREGEDEVVRRLDPTTGREAWKASYPAPYELNPAAAPHGKGPKATPALAAGKLYTLGISGILSCLDAATGRVEWRHDFRAEFPQAAPAFGAAASPLVDGDRVIVHVGGQNAGALTAFDTRTGEARWRWTADGPAYASPVIAMLGGARQLITQTQKSCAAFSPATGELLWQLPFNTPYEQNSVTPVVAGDLVVFGGLRQPTFACRVRREGDRWVSEKLWQAAEATFYMSTPVADRTRIYGMSERQRGQLVTLDAATGKTLWSGEARFGDNAAILDLGTSLAVLTPDAQLRILRKEGDSLQQAARYQVADGQTWATPALAGNRILVKDNTALYLWELP